MAAALVRLGVDARVGGGAGQVLREYSVNARGRSKLVGIGQRVTSGAAPSVRSWWSVRAIA